MQEAILNGLRARRSKIHEQWEALLRAEPVGTPLAHPDSLVHLIDWTLDEVLSALSNPLARQRTVGTKVLPVHKPHCPCGKNPLLTYFAAGEQALREALVLSQASAAPLDPLERDASLAELSLVLQNISRREIEAFCGVCQFRTSASGCAVQPIAIHGR